ncbi:MAG TPA: hypothetical protein VHY80_16225, partial [Stellaceae bacterium]|nr:hypothetical protein [Stellaceae bacterium]
KDEMEKRGQRWAPYRSVASWYLWRAADIATQRERAQGQSKPGQSTKTAKAEPVRKAPKARKTQRPTKIQRRA